MNESTDVEISFFGVMMIFKFYKFLLVGVYANYALKSLLAVCRRQLIQNCSIS